VSRNPGLFSEGRGFFVFYFGKNLKAVVIPFLFFANSNFCIKNQQKNEIILGIFFKNMYITEQFKKYEAHKMSMERVRYRLNYGGGVVPVDIHPVNNPVILLYSVDPDWTQDEKDEVIHLTTQLGHALIDMGHPMVLVPMRTTISPPP